MKFNRARQSKKGRIEIIPMIDVMFFLLATFMLASLSMHHLDALPVNLTKGKAAKVTKDEKITLTINAENQLFLNKQSVNLESLPVSLKPLLANSDGVLIIASDKDAKQGVVSSAMLKAREAGALHFSIIVQSQ